MKREAGAPCLSAVFVDYDNIYLSLKRKSEEAAKCFAKDAGRWLREIENGRLITATNSPAGETKRRIVMNRCYGNPVPRRNAHDNSTDMNSFPFVRHHFLRAGFEVIDCPPLTAQLKNSSDIRMVMDVRDYLTHETYFDEFVILSGDADFTPLLHRLRAHARRTVIFANDFTAAPYVAISDGEVREADLINLLLDEGDAATSKAGEDAGALPARSGSRADDMRNAIVAEVVAGVRTSATPVPLEALADRAVRALGHEKTIASGWGGAGSFRELLRQSLPQDVRLTDGPPYLAFDPKRHRDIVGAPPASEARNFSSAMVAVGATAGQGAASASSHVQAVGARSASPNRDAAAAETAPSASRVSQNVGPSQPRTDFSANIQQSVARIQEACQAPPLAPPEYRLLFEIMAKEISDNDLIGAQTLTNITQRAQERGLNVRRDDVRFILEVVSEADPWFEQGASANLFAGRFRNFVVARCRGQGLHLSAEELDMIDAWFAGGSFPATSAPARSLHQPQLSHGAAQGPSASQHRVTSSAASTAGPAESRGSRWWGAEEDRASGSEPRQALQTEPPSDEFPRIVRSRLRG